ncbi:MAG: hypothetical protein GPOALKHO_001238 [Sodalis sp.]|nr:MAG: hypothetical protein GPOALKHO_001238 [Sodalis sp.]
MNRKYRFSLVDYFVRKTTAPQDLSVIPSTCKVSVMPIVIDYIVMTFICTSLLYSFALSSYACKYFPLGSIPEDEISAMFSFKTVII